MAITQPAEITAGQLATLKNHPLYGPLTLRADAAQKLASLDSAVDIEWVVTVYDKLWRPVGEVGDDMIELSGTDPRNNLPSAKLMLKAESTLIPIMMNCKTTMVRVTVESEGLRFSYYVDSFDYEYKENGEVVGTAN